MTYNTEEGKEQGRIAKLIGNLILPEVAIQHFVKSGLKDFEFFSKHGGIQTIFTDYKNELNTSLIDYKFQNFDNFLKRQKERVLDQASNLHNSVCGLIPKLNLIEASLNIPKQPTIVELQMLITYNLYLQLRDNCEELINNFLIEDIHGSNVKPQQKKSDTLRLNLINYGFLNLKKVNSLNDPDQLIKLISDKSTPYQIAMFEFLLFNALVKKEYAKNRVEKRNALLAEILGVSQDIVKKNILSLNTLGSFENDFLKRYTAHTYIQTVKNDYFSLAT